MYTVHDLYDLTHTQAAPLLEKVTYPWEALEEIGAFILSLGETLSAEDYDHPADDVWIAKSAVVAPTASITGPCIIGPETEVRQCAFIRGKALVGAGCVVGNSTELKNVILFDKHRQTPGGYPRWGGACHHRPEKGGGHAGGWRRGRLQHCDESRNGHWPGQLGLPLIMRSGYCARKEYFQVSGLYCREE